MTKINLSEQKTVLILGAGASNRYGFPLGFELKRNIYGFASNETNKKAMVDLGFDKKLVDSFSEDLHYARHETIDSFLEVKPKYRDIGSYAIANAILPLERTGHLFSYQNSWYWDLFQELGFDKKQSNAGNLSIVTLNYDRSLEHFINKCIDVNLHDNHVEIAHQRRSELRIVHAHGALGNYPQLPYGHTGIDPKEFFELSKNIRIVSDRLEDTEEFQKAKKVIYDAFNVVFLGFGYNSRTLSALITSQRMNNQQYFGTAWSLDEAVRQSTLNFFNTAITLGENSQGCEKFLEVIGITSPLANR